MRTVENLSDEASHIFLDVRHDEVRIEELIDVYDGWRSTDHQRAPEASAPSVVPPALLRDIHQRLGLARETSHDIEAVGDALNALVDGKSLGTIERWHATKLNALNSGDRDKTMIAIRHLDVYDYDDELLVTVLLESLARAEEALATLYAVVTGMTIDPGGHENLTRRLFEELVRYETGRSTRASFFALTIEQMFENHPEATIPLWLTRQWGELVVCNDEAASTAALIDLVAKALHREQCLDAIEEWFSSPNSRVWSLAISAIRSAETSTLPRESQRWVCDLLNRARSRVSTTIKVPSEVERLNGELQRELLHCL